MTRKRSTVGVVTIFVVVTVLVATVTVCCKSKGRHEVDTVPISIPTLPLSPPSTSNNERTSRSLLTWNREEEETLVLRIREKLVPTALKVDENNVLEPKQFLHLHNMKSG